MSAVVDGAIVNPDRQYGSNEALGQGQPAHSASHKNYKGFVAGIFSGIAKLSVGHPFDTLKVRLQTTEKAQFKGPVDCLLQTIRHEGVRGLYKGATPPLVGWMFMDSLMLGSLTFYRRLLHENMFSSPTGFFLNRLSRPYAEPADKRHPTELPTLGHAVAGVMAGWTVSFVAAPIEHVKARLQIQYAAEKSKRLYSGPIDCTKKIYRAHGIRGIYHGLSATLLFRSFFFFWWGSYDLFTRLLSSTTNLSTPSINFWAGGLSAQVFWLTSYPSDVVKQRIMTDGLGSGANKTLGHGVNEPPRMFPRWRDAARHIWRRDGPKGFWRGFAPCFLRAFPANAVALMSFEGVMRALPD